MSLLDDSYRRVTSLREFHNVLQQTRAGNLIIKHTTSLENLRRLGGKTECPQQQTAEQARALLTQLKKEQTCFGIPTPLPRVIAMLNLSGERLLVYSKDLSLVRQLVCAGVDAHNGRVGVGVDEMCNFAQRNDATLLLTLSLPWQSGASTGLYWEIRSVRRNGEGQLVDGELWFSQRSDETQEAAPVQPIPSKVQAEIVRRFDEEIRAVDLDVAPDSATLAAVPAEQQIKKMRATLEEMGKERKAHNAVLREQQHKANQVLKGCRDQMQAQLDEAAKAHEETKKKLREMEEAHKKTEEKWEGERRKLAGENISLDSNLEKSRESTKAAKELKDAALKAERAAVQTLAHEREEGKLRTEAMVEGNERRISELTLKINSISSQLAIEKNASEQKESLLDRVRAERDALHFELRQKARTLLCARATLLLGQNRIVEQRRVAKKKLDDATHKAKAAEKKATAARKTADEVSKEVKRMEKREAEATAVTQTTEAVAETRTSVDACINTEPTGDPPEVLQLQKILDDKHNEIDALRKQVEQGPRGGGHPGGGVPAIDALLANLAVESRRAAEQIYHATQERSVSHMYDHGGGHGSNYNMYYEPQQQGYYHQ